jgi:hypothetical protein
VAALQGLSRAGDDDIAEESSHRATPRGMSLEERIDLWKASSGKPDPEWSEPDLFEGVGDWDDPTDELNYHASTTRDVAAY